MLRVVHSTEGWLVNCFGFSGPLRQYFSLYRAVSQREGGRGKNRGESICQNNPTASATGPSPTIILIVGRPTTGASPRTNFTQDHHTGGGGGGAVLERVCGRPTLALDSAFVHQTKKLQTTKTKRIKYKRNAKRAASIEGQVATMLESYTRQIDTIDTTIKRMRKK